MLTPNKHWKIQAKETARWQGDTTRQAGRLRGAHLATSSGDNMLIRWDRGKFWSEELERTDRCVSPHHPGHHAKITTDFLYREKETRLPESVMLRSFLGSIGLGSTGRRQEERPWELVLVKIPPGPVASMVVPSTRLVEPSHLLRDVSLLSTWTANRNECRPA